MSTATLKALSRIRDRPIEVLLLGRDRKNDKPIAGRTNSDERSGRHAYSCRMAGLSDRVLVRLSDIAPLTAAQVNEALAKGLTWKTYRSPGVEATQAVLEGLERQGLAELKDDGWQLTRAGASQYQRLEDLFDNSNGHGDYGF